MRKDRYIWYSQANASLNLFEEQMPFVYRLRTRHKDMD